MLVKLDDWATVRCKNCDDVLSRFYLIPERNGQTDLLYQYRASVTHDIGSVSMLMRDKNRTAMINMT